MMREILSLLILQLVLFLIVFYWYLTRYPTQSNPTQIPINDDLLIEILKRAPIKTIARFRCVCKSWNSTISSPLFINLHQSFTSSTKPYLLLDSFPLPVSDSWIQSIQRLFLKTISRSLTIYHPHQTHYLRSINYPFEPLQTHPNLAPIDAIHGVICVSYSKSTSFDSTFLWNPSICTYVDLPTPTRIDAKEEKGKLAIGFGFDKSKIEFKVVRTWITESRIEYEVYSSRTGRWSKSALVNINSYAFITRIGFFYNGCVNWLISKSNGGNKYSLLVFDCVEEVFREIEVPGKAVMVAEYLGKLVVVWYSFREERFKVWAMEENEVWKEMCTIPQVVYYDENKVTLVVNKDGDYIRFENWNMNDSDPNTHGFYQPLRGRVFEETMLLMDAPNCKCYTSNETVFI